MNDLKLIKNYEWLESETYEKWIIWDWNLWKLFNDLKLIKAYEWLETYEWLKLIETYEWFESETYGNLWMIWNL